MAIRITQHYVDAGGTVTSGKLRASRQYVEAVTQTSSGKLRASRQYVDVLISVPTTHTESVSQTLSFSSVANTDYNKAASSSLSFVSTVGAFVLNQNVDSDISFSQSAHVQSEIILNPSSVLSLSDQLNRTGSQAASNTITFIHYSTVDLPPRRNVAESSLSLSDVASAEGFKGVSHDLGISDSVDVRGPILLQALSSLFFTDSVVNLSKFGGGCDHLLFVDFVNYEMPHHAANTLNFTQFAQIERGDSTLSFTDVVEVGKSKRATSTLSFSQSGIQSGGTFRRGIGTDLGITQHLTYYELGGCINKKYTPFAGEGSQVPVSLPKPQYVTNASQKLLLYYPSRGVRESTVTIRPPRFGNRDRGAYTRINRETLGGHLIVYANPTWPSKRSIHVTITGLTKSDVDDVQNLFYTYLGKQIGLTDWEGNEWEGVIVDPNQPVTQDGKAKWTISFTFEGDMIDGYSPGNLIEPEESYTLWKDPGANTDLGIVDSAGGASPEGTRGTGIKFVQVATVTVETP